jgi:protein TonB
MLKPMRFARFPSGLVLLLALSCLLAGCGLFKSEEKEAAKEPAAPASEKAAEAKSNVPTVRLITQQTPVVKTYRKTAAAHIYKMYPKRVYKGKIPPLVYAVVVVETDVDASGKVLNVFYSRVPSHAPEVPPKIAELIKEASPLPNPGKLGAHTYVETWLWDKGGNFQLDSLTLGQRSR